MDSTQILIIVLIVVLLGVIAVFWWVYSAVRNIATQVGRYDHQVDSVENAELSQVFTEEFKSQLQGKAIARFDEVMKQNSLFLEQDLRLSSAQINKHLEDTIKNTLKVQLEEFQKTIESLKDTTIRSITSTQTLIDARRAEIDDSLQKTMQSEQARMIANMEKHIGQVITRYIKAALGEGIDLNTQTEFVLKALEDHKEEIKKDIVGDV